MFKNYFKTAFRNFRKNKFYTAINVVGLAVGLTTCMMIMLYVLDELSYDKYNKQADNIYRIDNEIKFGVNHFDLAVTAALEGATAVREIPGILQYTRMQNHGDVFIKKGGEKVNEPNVAWADSTLLQVFTLPLIAGDPSNVLRAPRTLIITEKIAKKYFNRTDVVGESLVFNDSINYKINAVIKDIPEQSHFKFDIFMAASENAESRSDNWLSENWHTYILVKPGTDMKKLAQALDNMTYKYIGPLLKTVLNQSIEEFKKTGAYVRNGLTPLTDIHLHSNKTDEIGANSSIQYVYIFSAIAVLILLIACVNFMNLSTARSSNRAKEIGVRKVLGSMRNHLIQQFLTESLIISFFSLLLAVAITILLLPYFNTLAGKNISIEILFKPSMLITLVALMIVVGLLAGSYPALFLSAFQPIEVLKGKLAKGFKGSVLRNILVVIQFWISIILIVGTIVIYNQLSYIKNKDIGFNRDQVMIVQNIGSLGSQADRFRDEVKQISGVEKITMTAFLPVDGYRSNDAFFTSPSLNQQDAISMQRWNVDENYIPAMDMKLTEGRNFSPEFLTDSTAIIINEAAAKFLATKDLLNKKLYEVDNIEQGRKLIEFHVIGVAKNFNFNSLREVVTPLALCFKKENSGMALRLKTTNLNAVIDQVKNKWQSLTTSQPFSYQFMDEQFNNLYKAEQRTGQIFITFAILAIVIACLGMFGLAAFASEQRTKEIGVRKVLGASVSNIATMLSKEFFKLVMISALLAFPVAWWAMTKWLEDFAYRVNISWWIFVLALVLVLVITLITVSFQAIKAALLNPVKSLRTE
ncbi:MAG: ABC transporter permease [Bacteroidetes bacterium]|nr:ABC transporter permease [Bacteroidota bacterium]